MMIIIKLVNIKDENRNDVIHKQTQAVKTVEQEEEEESLIKKVMLKLKKKKINGN